MKNVKFQKHKKTPSEASDINVLKIMNRERKICCIWNSNKQKKDKVSQNNHLN